MINRYSKTKIKRTSKSINYYTNTLYPEIPPSIDDVYILTEVGDRLDTLASVYYKNSSLWWIISKANPDKIRRDGLLLKPGIQIRIPSDFNKVIKEYTGILPLDSYGRISTCGRSVLYSSIWKSKTFKACVNTAH